MARPPVPDENTYVGLRQAGLTLYQTASRLHMTHRTASRLEHSTEIGVVLPRHVLERHERYTMLRDGGLTQAQATTVMGVADLVVRLSYEPTYQARLNNTGPSSGSWWKRAVCARPGVSTDIWEISTMIHRQHPQARPMAALCGVCTVRAECRQDAVENQDLDLARGGMTPRELKAEYDRRAKVLLRGAA